MKGFEGGCRKKRNYEKSFLHRERTAERGAPEKRRTTYKYKTRTWNLDR